MRFDIITIFPALFDSFLKESLLSKAMEKKLIDIRAHQIRDFIQGKHKIADDTPYGGGPGMVLKIEPIFKAVSNIVPFKKKGNKFVPRDKKTRVVFLTPRGKKFNQTMAWDWFRTTKRIVFISGRYEGVDERVRNFCTDVISVGSYITLGGEVPVMAVVETVARLVPGVVGRRDSIEKSDFPQFTRPEVYEPKKGLKWRVPKILLTGDHKKIEDWRNKHEKIIR